MGEKNSDLGIKILVLSVLSIFFVASFVFASHVITLASGGTSTTALEDVSSFYNISVNNSDSGQDANITEVNITFPSGFTFESGTQGSDSVSSFSNSTNSSVVLSWSNTTDYVLNGTDVFYFWFNATGTTPGDYNFSVATTNSSGTSYTNISVTVNDTTSPSTAAFETPTESDGANLSRDNIAVNVSGTDNGVIGYINIRLYNSTENLVNSTISSASATSYFFNFTSLTDGVYYFNATVNDTYGNANDTSTRTVIVDTTNPLISFGAGTLNDNVNVTQSNIYMNVSVTETNEKNITFTIYNSSGSSINSTTYTDGTRVYNVTSLSDGTYTYNVTMYDYAGNTNTTGRTITLDNTGLVLSFVTPSEVAGANISQDFIEINVTASDDLVEIDTFNISLYNSSFDVIYSNSSTSSPLYVNYSSLSDGTYYFNVTGNDSLGNTANSSTRTVLIDSVDPNVTSLIAPADDTSATTTAYTFQFNATDTNPINYCTLILDDSAVANSSTTMNNSGGTNGIYYSGIAVGTHNWTISCTDYSSNTGTSSQVWDLIVTAATNESSGRSSSGGSGSSVVTPIILSDKGIVRTALVGQSFSFNLGSGKTLSKHKVTVGLIDSNNKKVSVTVASNPQTADIPLGGSRKFNLDGNGYYDVLVEVLGLKESNNGAGIVDLKISSIHELVPVQNTLEEPRFAPEDEGNVEPEQVSVDSIAEDSEESSSGEWIIAIVILLLVVVAGIVVGVNYKSKKRKSKRN